MSGLLFKEFYTLKRYIVSYGAVLVMFAFISVYMKSAAYLQAMLATSLGMLTFTGMTYDKMYGWDKMVLTMPVCRGTAWRWDSAPKRRGRKCFVSMPGLLPISSPFTTRRATRRHTSPTASCASPMPTSSRP